MGDPLEGVIRISYGTGGAVSLSCVATALAALTVEPTGDGSGTVTSDPAGIACGATCSASFPQDSSVTLTAAASPGSMFLGWGGSCTGTGPCTVRMDQDRTVTSNFAPTSTIRLTLTNTRDDPISLMGTNTVHGPDFTCSVTGLNSTTQCDPHVVPAGVSLLLYATFSGDDTVGSWSGPCASAGPALSCRFTPTAGPVDITVTFYD